jgi:5-methylcytosine-specific restriction endonuclease McrA
MGKRQKAWARAARARLISILGGACTRCGATEQLEFDCTVPTGDAHHRFDTSHRMSFYHRQYQLGNLDLLCEVCNNIKSARDTLYLQHTAATTRAPCPAQGNDDDAPF